MLCQCGVWSLELGRWLGLVGVLRADGLAGSLGALGAGLVERGGGCCVFVAGLV